MGKECGASMTSPQAQFSRNFHMVTNWESLNPVLWVHHYIITLHDSLNHWLLGRDSACNMLRLPRGGAGEGCRGLGNWKFNPVITRLALLATSTYPLLTQNTLITQYSRNSRVLEDNEPGTMDEDGSIWEILVISMTKCIFVQNQYNSWWHILIHGKCFSSPKVYVFKLDLAC